MNYKVFFSFLVAFALIFSACIDEIITLYVEDEVNVESIDLDIEHASQARMGGLEESVSVVVNLGFVGYYPFEGSILPTSIHWQQLEQDDHIDWEAVDAAYADWIAVGGLVPNREVWLTSGHASFSFKDYAGLGFKDFDVGQFVAYYKSYYIDPGYVTAADPVCDCCKICCEICCRDCVCTCGDDITNEEEKEVEVEEEVEEEVDGGDDGNDDSHIPPMPTPVRCQNSQGQGRICELCKGTGWVLNARQTRWERCGDQQ